MRKDHVGSAQNTLPLGALNWYLRSSWSSHGEASTINRDNTAKWPLVIQYL